MEPDAPTAADGLQPIGARAVRALCCHTLPGPARLVVGVAIKLGHLRPFRTSC